MRSDLVQQIMRGVNAADRQYAGDPLMPLRPRDLARDLERGLNRRVSGFRRRVAAGAGSMRSDRWGGTFGTAYDERELMQVETGFQWHQLTEQANTMSLFAPTPAARRACAGETLRQRRGRNAARVSRQSAAGHAAVVAHRTSRWQQRGAAWFKKIESVGASCSCGPLDPRKCRLARAKSRRIGLEIDQRRLGLSRKQR